VDAVLLMDSSGSMAKNDPHQLRIPAAKLFMSLLGQDDRVGLISFSDNGYPVLHLTAPGPERDARILGAADKVSSRGVYTNLYAALLKGVEMLDREAQPGKEKMLILMSDGKMDVGDSGEDERLRGLLEDELLATIKEKQIRVYTIAFTSASDIELLKSVARQSGALFKLANNDTDLHEVFSDIFETAKSPDMLPVEGGQFSVDASIEEVTIVGSKEREEVRIFLRSPDGRELSSDDADDKLKWFVSEHFDMITLNAPQPGTWKLLFSAGRNRAYIVTNMTLNHNSQPPNLRVGEHRVIESWLEQDGALLDREAVLSNTRFSLKVQGPDGTSSETPLDDTGEHGDTRAVDGVYTGTLSFEQPGSYQVEIVAQGETFTRQKTLHYEVLPAAAETADTQAPAPATAQPAPEPPPEPEDQPPVSESEPEPQEPVDAAPAGNKLNLGLALGVFLGVNLLLGLVGFGIWWFLNKRKQKAAEPEEDVEEA
jgi:hypothetical protein